ncbi:cubilin [Hypanus sabinus]|uniref:cubilin n=1 Tax=Hypanus sabinus TaxID=79690 RepID=UPI0028C4F6E1|nr:cubilin [Hypanus sabinus]
MWLKCEFKDDGNNQQRSVRSDQPRVISKNGNLIFQTGNLRNIEFKTSALGKIKLNNDDVEQLFLQIRKNKDDIAELRTTEVQSLQNVSYQINQLNKRGPTCSDDINECEVYAGSSLACQNGGTCINTEGSYSCTCTPEWYGPQCTSKHDDCQDGLQTKCEHGICIDLNRVQPNKTKYHCICEAGWSQSTAGSACSSDIDECSLPVQPCSTNPLVPCFNSPGSYSCGTCPEGWLGDGHSCQDIDECKTNNGECSQAPIVQCINTMGSYHCGSCPTGYQGDGKNCTLSDVCSVNNGGCHHFASCSYNPGAIFPSCTCPADYFGNGYGVNGCIPLIDLCQRSNPCVNGQCFAIFSSYICICHPGWTGTHCNQNIDECASNPCKNGGNCTDGINSYSCTCTQDWTGPECQLPQGKMIKVIVKDFFAYVKLSVVDQTLQIASFTSFLFLVCSSHLNETYGVISSPGYPGNYPPYTDCYWTISANPNFLINFAFGRLHIEPHENCSFDYLEIRDGLLDQDPILHKYCGNENPPPLLTSGPAAWIHFHSDKSNSGQGFYVTYITLPAEPDCGGTYGDSEGILTSPNWPRPYPSSRQCIYVIEQPIGERILLQFTHMDLEFHVNCSLDYIEVHDGEAETDHLIGKFCGTEAPAPITTSGNKLWLKFKTSVSVTRRGFVAVYKVACGGTLYNKGVIQSPYYPELYPHDRSCKWVITQPEGQVVSLKFISFDVEEAVNCSHDYLEIRDGATIDSPLIGKFCGGVLPPPVQSVQTSMYVMFKMDSKKANNTGFQAEYEPAKKGCGEVLTQSIGTITSPGYPHGGKCIWYISVQAGQVIRLTFISFNVEFSMNCSKDYMEVYDNSINFSRLIGRYCGMSVPPSITSSGNLMRLLFVTNSNTSSKGFLATYDSLDTSKVCRKEFFESTGTFTSPNYPSGFSIYRECIYIITVEDNKQIRLNFTDFKVEGYQTCTSAYVEIRNGGYETSPLVGQYCSAKAPPLIISHSNRLWIKFKSDNIFEYHAFMAYWDGNSSGCGGTLTTATGSFTSPNYPMPYSNNAECYWLIQSSAGSVIELQFEQFHLDSSTGCMTDSLSVYNGINTNSQILAKLCGNQTPAPILSSKNNMYIKLQTDSSLTAGGFLAKYRHICQGIIIANHSKGILESTNFPQPYPPNQDCNWTIQATAGSTINYTFTAFNLHFDYCNSAWLKLYDGSSAQSHLIGTFCGNTLPPSGKTSGTSLHVAFHSESSFPGNGFQMLWFQNGCGRIVTAPKGEIHSPNYPHPYGINVDCSWVISVDKYYSIFLNFLDFDLGDQESCNFNYVAVYDGSNEGAPMLKKLCGSIVPEGITSSQNVARIHFRSRNSHDHRGFRVQFNQVCGSYIVTDDIGGAITSPLYPNNYSNNQNCSWIIQAQKPFKHVTISFTDLAIENNGANCSADVLQILDGDKLTAPSVGRYCGNTIPYATTSSSNALFVNFISNDVISFRGFRATYAASASACGGTFHMQFGAFSSPNYPENYPSNSECIWYIISSPGNRVQISFISFDIGNSFNCSLDYVEIREMNATGELIGHFCGSALPANCTSVVGHILWVKFVSGPSSNHSGFSASFSHLYGNEIVGIQGQIASPLWPLYYPHNVNYHWTITAPAFYIIHARIQELDINALHECRFDKLLFYDGSNIHARLIGKFCGSELPPAVTSTGSTLTVQFISDSTITGKGFLIEWFAVRYIADPTATPTLQPGSCGGVVVTGESPTFLFSPGWPSNYGAHLDCAWIIWAPQSTVELNILALDIELDTRCRYDKLVIRDGDNNLSPILATLCGRGLPGTLRSTGETMFLRFTSDESSSGGGFNASYHKTCGGHVTADHGVISSPYYPHAYTPNLNCTWRVDVTSGFIIAIHFNQPFQIKGSGTNCTYGDYLELKNGPDKFSPPLTSHEGIGRYCGESPPIIMHTTDNQLFVHFTSDESNEGQGFKFTYHASNLACGGNIFISDSDDIGYITSMNYPNEYSENIDCIWTITVRSDDAVQLDFESDFYIENHPECNLDYLELRDGANSNAPLIGHFCGSTKPSSQRSTGTVMYVRFQTNSALNYVGFKAKYSIVTCGGKISAQSGTLQSPRFPSLYPDNSHCEWFLEGPTGHYLTITFEVFNVENATNCTKDFVEIREHNASGRLLGRNCGNTLPRTMETSDSFAYVVFSSDASVNDTGFSLHFVASIEECGGEMTAGTGTISSPNYPHLYPHSRECQWRITVQVGRRVTLTFNDLRLEMHNNCNYDYVEIYNGFHPNSPRLQKYCGIVESGTQVKSSGNTMRVVFVTDMSTSNGGFNATYTSEEEAVCGSTLMDANPGYLSSPGFDGVSNYGNNLNCEWVIQNSRIANSSIYIEFTNFHIGHQQTCKQDYIEIQIGDSNGDLIAKLCGQTAPNPLLIPFTQLWVHFISDSSGQNLGFIAKYSFTECGGIQKGENGFISSPNFPSPYSPLTHCAWMLEAPEGQTINLNFSYFNLTCNRDSFTILNGGSFNSPIIGHYCGTIPAEAIKSGSNKLFIIFNSNYSMQHGSFFATWKSDSLGCGGFVHAETGSFKSPNWPQRFPDNSECTWKITGQESNHLEITFDENFQIPDSTNICEASYVKIWGGTSEIDETLLATFCGSSPPPRPVIAPANIVTVRFQSKGSPGIGFSASYTSRCGANFTAPAGRIVSPNYPGHYDSNLNCEYLINAASHQLTVLQFETFDVEEDSQCSYDKLKIYNGTTVKGYHVATLCGSVIPGPISIYGPMLLVFSTDSIKAHTGFVANYHLVSCGGRFHGSTGTLTSPIYSLSQYGSMNCTYHITVGVNRIVKIIFDEFNLDASSTCTSNYVAVYNGPSTFAPLLGQFCGSENPPILRSTNNSIFLVFKTNGIHTYGGWRASYTETLGSFAYYHDIEIYCHSFFTKSCKSPPNSTVTVLPAEAPQWFEVVAPQHDLETDFGQVYRLCGSNLTAADFYSYGRTIRIDSKSKAYLQGNKFQLTYQVAGCNRQYNHTYGYLKSPDWSNIYPHNLDCTIILRAPDNYKISLFFNALDIKGQDQCSNDYLEVRNGTDSHGQVLGKFCGAILPDPVFPNFHGLTLHFYSDAPATHSGFEITWTSSPNGCGGTLLGPRGSFNSPNYPSTYDINTDCEWIIEAPTGRVITINFTVFNINDPGDCVQNYLRLFDGPDSNSPHAGTYCGLGKNIAPFISASHHVFVKFHAETVAKPSGFRITWTSSMDL